MICKVYCDGNLLYHTRMGSLMIHNPSLELEVNKTGSFEFTVQHGHVYYDLIRKLKSIITVYQDDYLLFRGRVLNEEVGWHNEKKVSCEGELAFLIDSIQRPYDFTGSITDFLSMLITSHNAQVDAEKQFTLGKVTVTDPNDYIVRADIEYTSTWDVIQKKLLDMLGGYIIVRHEDGKHYLDYLSSINVLSPQKITFGKNLLDLKRIRKGEDIATVIIPLGAKLKDAEGKETDKRLTIESVNGGVDYVQDADAVSQFGRIVKTVIFDDVTEAQNLKTKGNAHLADSVKQAESIELTAADLAATGQDIASFHIATMVDAQSDPHGLNQRFLVSKLSLKLHEPGANKMTLGGVIKTFTQQNSTPVIVQPKDGRDGQDAVTLRIDSSKGTVFKNSEVSTVLNVVIYKGGKTITDAVSMRAEFGNNAHLEWQWQRMGEATFGTILTTDSRLSNEGFALSLTPSDVDTKVVFKCQLVTE